MKYAKIFKFIRITMKIGWISNVYNEKGRKEGRKAEKGDNE